MSVKTPIRTVFDGDNNATGLSEYQSGEFIGLTHGGLRCFIINWINRSSFKG